MLVFSSDIYNNSIYILCHGMFYIHFVCIWRNGMRENNSQQAGDGRRQQQRQRKEKKKCHRMNKQMDKIGAHEPYSSSERMKYTPHERHKKQTNMGWLCERFSSMTRSLFNQLLYKMLAMVHLNHKYSLNFIFQ